jgi:hypothetical protein
VPEIGIFYSIFAFKWRQNQQFSAFHEMKCGSELFRKIQKSSSFKKADFFLG